MTTYINLCKRLRSEVGASGSDSTIVDARGEWKRICDWIAQAWLELQEEEPNWDWMRKSKTFNTIAEQGEYPYASAPLSLADFAYWRNGSFRIYKDTADNEQMLEQWPYEIFRDEYLFGSNRATYSRPTVISVSPTNSLVLGLPPDDVYTIVTEYHKAPTELTADANEPDMPSRFHMAIVYKAMIHYGMYESAQEVVARGREEYQKMLERLRFDQLPMPTVNRSFLS